MRSALGADVVVVLFYYVHRGLLGGRRASRGADVARYEVLLLIGVGALVLGDQAARAGIWSVIEQQAVDVLVARILVVLDVIVIVIAIEVRGGVGFLLVEQLVEGFPLLLLLGGGAEPYPGRPAVRRGNAAVEGSVAELPVQRVVRVLALVVLEVLRLRAFLIWHLPAPLDQGPVVTLRRRARGSPPRRSNGQARS